MGNWGPYMAGDVSLTGADKVGWWCCGWVIEVRCHCFCHGVSCFIQSYCFENVVAITKARCIYVELIVCSSLLIYQC